MQKGKWERIIETDPGHTQRFIDKFEQAAAAGRDVVREARLIDVMVPRQAAIMDAGCGAGRHSAYLADQGHKVVGVDVDPGLIDHARATIPDATFVHANLADYELPPGVPTAFDAILCAGNVMGFVHPETRVAVLTKMAEHLTDDGRAVIGFSTGRGYAFDDFFADAKTAGLQLSSRFSTWDLRPFTESSNFLVAIFTARRRPALGLVQQLPQLPRF